MRSLRTVALGAALIFGVAATAAAQSTRPDTAPGGRDRSSDTRKMRMRGGSARALFRGIELSDAQKQQIRTIRERHKPEFQVLREQRKQARPQTGDGRQRPDSATVAQFRTLKESEPTE